MPYKRELEIARLTLGLVSTISTALFNSSRFGTRADDVVLCCAIFVGQAERRPMTAAKLAGYSGMPRATVARKLRQFEREQVVTLEKNGTVSLALDVFSPASRAHTDANSQRILKTAATLSKMDTSRIATRKRS